MEPLATWVASEGRLAEEHAVGWIVRLAKALEPVHQIGVAHGRLGAQALLLDGPSCHEAGVILGVNDLRDEVPYHSPERAIGAAPSSTNDTWAAAVMLYVALTGALPFPARTDEELRLRFAGNPPRRLEEFGIHNDQLQRVLDRALSIPREGRLDSVKLLGAELVAIYPASDLLGPLELGAVGQEPASSLDPSEPAAAAPPESPDHDDDVDVDDEEETRVVTQEALLVAMADRPPAAAPAPAETAATRKPAPGPARPDEAPPAEAQTRRSTKRTPLGGVKPFIGFRSVEPTLKPPPRDGPQILVAGPPERESEPGVPPASGPPPLPTAGRGEPGPPPSSRRQPPPPPSRRTPKSVEPRAAQPESPRPPEDSQEIDLDALESKVAEPFRRASQPGARAAPPPPQEPAEEHATRAQDAKRPLPAPDKPAAKPRSAQPPATPARAKLRVKEAVAPPPARPHPGKRKRGGRRFHQILQALLLCLIAGGVFFWFRPDLLRKTEGWVRRVVIPKITGEPPAPPAAPEPTDRARPTPPDSTATSPSAEPPSARSGEPVGDATAAAASAGKDAGAASADAATDDDSAPARATPATPPADLRECVAAAYPPDTFRGVRTNFDFLCTETDPREGATALKVQAVLRGRTGVVTTAMQEWALLGWFEIGAFVVVRTRCCAEPTPLSTPRTLMHCEVDEGLDGLAALTAKSSSDAVDQAIAAYYKAMGCLFRVGAGSSFGMLRPSPVGSEAAFRKLLKRLGYATE